MDLFYTLNLRIRPFFPSKCSFKQDMSIIMISVSICLLSCVLCICVVVQQHRLPCVWRSKPPILPYYNFCCPRLHELLSTTCTTQYYPAQHASNPLNCTVSTYVLQGTPCSCSTCLYGIVLSNPVFLLSQCPCSQLWQTWRGTFRKKEVGKGCPYDIMNPPMLLFSPLTKSKALNSPTSKKPRTTHLLVSALSP